jgi:hypothetical protein
MAAFTRLIEFPGTGYPRGVMNVHEHLNLFRDPFLHASGCRSCVLPRGFILFTDQVV